MKRRVKNIFLLFYFSMVLITTLWKGWHPSDLLTSATSYGYWLDHTQSFEGHQDADKGSSNHGGLEIDSDIITVLVPVEQLPYDYWVKGSRVCYYWIRACYQLPSFEIVTPPPQLA